jgi:hypothetical protein
MEAAEFAVEALADNLAIANDHRADQRIRADPTPPALGQLKGAPEKITVDSCN